MMSCFPPAEDTLHLHNNVQTYYSVISIKIAPALKVAGAVISIKNLILVVVCNVLQGSMAQSLELIAILNGE